MKIGIFANLLAGPMNGMSRYLYELAREFSTNPEIELVALSRHPLLYGEEFFDNHIRLPSHPNRFSHITEILLLAQVSKLIRAEQFNLLHHPAQSPPIYFWFLPGKKLITIHGASEFELPEELRPRRPMLQALWMHTVQYRLLSARIDGFITPSVAATSSVAKHYRLPGSKIHTIPYGINHDFFYSDSKPRAKELIANKFGIKDEFLLHISHYQPAKNLPNQLRAFARSRNLIGDDVKFVIAGDSYYGFEEVERTIKHSGLEESVIILPQIVGEELRMLYSRAKVFMFASIHESFGFPILEAMACGTPVITSSRYSMPEVAGDAALTVDPLDVDAIAEAIKRLFEDEKLYATLQRRGLDRVRSYSWRQSVTAHLETFEVVISR